MLLNIFTRKPSSSSRALFYSSYVLPYAFTTSTCPTHSKKEQADEKIIVSSFNLSAIPGAGAVGAPRRLAVECNRNHLGFNGREDNISAVKKIQHAGAFFSRMSVTCSNQSDHGKECSASCVSSENTLVTEHQCIHTGLEDQLSKDNIQQDEVLLDTDCSAVLKEYSLPTSFGKQFLSQSRKPKPNQRSLERVTGSNKRKFENSKRHITIEPFDICRSLVNQSESESEDLVFGGYSEDEGDDEYSEEDQPSEECQHKVLRSGMVLLKKYISRTEQISIVRKCRQLGLGRGGFYQPGYDGGAKLRLHMMCLGMDWDPQTRKYQKQRRIDRAKPPDIPSEFHLLVKRAMHDSLALIRTDCNVTHAEEILPRVTPDVCIVNFYNETGRLGLHQDRDESTESLCKRLPVVSLSVGNAAEFLYGDQRDVNKADKLVLESGDVLIFGGESRHVYHGINSIIPDSAPGFLQEEIKLRPGRLNLTFRKY